MNLLAPTTNFTDAGFTAKGEHRAGVNEGPGLACHKPLTETDFSFPYAKLRDFAEAR